MKDKLPSELSRWLRLGAILWVGVMTYLWQYNAVPMYDDISYSRMVAGGPKSFWEGEGKLIETWGEVGESVANHYKYINGRLTNTLMFATILTPRWVSSGLLAVLVMLMLWGLVVAAEQASGRRLSAAIVWAAAFGMWWWLPWEDNMISLDYALNYVTPSATALIYGMAFLSGKLGRNAPLFWLGALAGVITGWLHEGFSLPLLGGAFILLVISRENRRSRLWLWLWLLAGAMICILAPSTFIRLAEQTETKGYIGGLMAAVRNLKPLFIPAAICAALTLLALIRLNNRNLREIFNQKILFWVLTGAGSVAMAIVLQGTGRMLWLAMLCMLVYTLAFIGCLWKIGEKTGIAGAILIAALSIVWTVFFVKVERKIAATQRDFIQSLHESRNGIVYVDLYPAEEIPWWTAGLLHQFFPTTVLWNIAYDYSLHQMPLVLPTAYEGLPFEEWPKVAGNNPFRGERDFLYSTTKIEEGTPFRAELGEKTPAKNPLGRMREDVIIESGEPMFAIDAKGDTLWTNNLPIPHNQRLKGLDRL